MPRIRLATLAVGGALALTLFGAAPAFATETPPPPPPDEFAHVEGPSRAPLSIGGGISSNGAVTTLGNIVSPSGCVGQTDRAHYSTKWVDNASVHGRTKCQVRVASLGVTTILQKQGWLYWESMQTAPSSRADANNSQDATPHWYCKGWGSQNYRGASTHWSQEATGKYTGNTVGEEWRFSC